jgi:hypothetical protein
MDSLEVIFFRVCQVATFLRLVDLCTNSKMMENQVFYPRIGYVEYDRKRDASYDRVFYRKSLT